MNGEAQDKFSQVLYSTAVVTLASNSAYTLGTANSATVAIADNDVALPTITISATDTSAAETLTGQTPNPGQFTITRTGSTATALTVNYSVGGTATNGSDYSSLTGSVVIPVGATSVTLPINVIDDSLVEGNETAIVTLLTNAAYTIGSANGATVNIGDNDAATVTDPIVATGTASSNSLINALSNPNFAYWNTSSNGGTISYSFLSSAGATSYYGSEIVSPVSEGIKSNVRSILSSLESLINVRFVEVADTATNYGVIRYMFSDGPSYAYAYYPYSNTDKLSGDVHLNPNYESDSVNRFSGTPGNHGYMALIHETFHALGLKHPGNYNGSGTGEGPFLSPAQDNTTNTVMSYNFNGSKAITPMAYDIQALQYIYGAKSNNAANTTYSFSTVHGYTVGGEFKGSTSQIKQSLWDSGGIDTLDFSGLAAATSYYFDMNQGGILTTQAAYNGLTYTDRSTGGTYTTSSFGTTLAYNTVIENLINSGGNDRIIANSAANQFLGYSFGTFTGNDIFESTSSSDVLELSGESLSNLTPTVSGTNLNIGLGSNGSLSIQNYYGSSGSMKFLVAGNYYTYNASTGWELTSAPAINSVAPDQATTGLTATAASPYNSPLPLRPVDCECAMCSASGKSMHTLGNSSLSEVIGIS
ncbi:Calx-beta domain-containing protein [Microseira sp. BLCC-F43]|uniref:Calx-beta domain-containing protein n=1 Tax=Microseira sp. BLCC-F43 TaxID=3153602 RepID=UPI0035BAA99B